MKKRILSVLTICFLVLTMVMSAFAHSGRTDSSGGHRDNKNKSGLGSYHYHCGGYPPHLHSNGVCPYKGSTTKNSSSSSSTSTNSSASNIAPKIVYATKIVVPNMPSTIEAGESITLNASVYPQNAQDKNISWESGDTSIVTVDSNGKLTAVGVGKTIITGKTSRGTASQFTITVAEVEAKSISIENKTEEMIIGDILKLQVNFTPENTTNKDIDWKSADDNIVSVNNEGKITALSVGKTTITATHKDLSDSFEISVNPILAKSVKISCKSQDTGEEYEEFRFKKGTKLKLETSVLPDDTTDKTITWSTDNPSVATVDNNGVVTTIGSGKAVITATTTNDITDTIEVEVYESYVTLIIVSGILLLSGAVFVRKKSKKDEII